MTEYIKTIDFIFCNILCGTAVIIWLMFQLGRYNWCVRVGMLIDSWTYVFFLYSRWKCNEQILRWNVCIHVIVKDLMGKFLFLRLLGFIAFEEQVYIGNVVNWNPLINHIFFFSFTNTNKNNTILFVES